MICKSQVIVKSKQFKNVIFISDIHLTILQPSTVKRFFLFTENEAHQCCALIILGDLFDFWIGDDISSDFYALVAKKIANITESGIPVFFMPGNRDFLLGTTFAKKAKMTLLEDPCIIKIGNENWILTHGDLLCTEDLLYQYFRKIVRCSLFIRFFLFLSPKIRILLASMLRKKAIIRNKKNAFDKKIKIKKDATKKGIRKLISNTGIKRIIHGHTHNSNYYQENFDETNWERWVLSEWDYDNLSQTLFKGNMLHIIQEKEKLKCNFINIFPI